MRYNPDTLQNSQLFNPLLESGEFLPNIRTVKDGTNFIWKDGDMRKHYVSFEGNWLKLNITKDDDLEVRNLFCDGLYANNFYAKSIRATNGDLIISDTGIVESVDLYAKTFTAKNPDGQNYNPFQTFLLYLVQLNYLDHLDTRSE